MAMNHRRYIAWFYSTIQVIVETWRAAGCRPYGHTGEQLRSPIIVNCPLSIVNFFPFPFRFIGQVGANSKKGGGQEGHEEADAEGLVLVAEGHGVGAF